MKTIYIAFYAICFLAASLQAQKSGQERLDSLLLDHKPGNVDTQQAKVLIDLSFTYNTIDPDKGIEFGKQGLAMAQKLNYKPGEIDAYRALGVNYGFGKSEFPDALIEFGKSLALCEETGNQVDAAKALNNLGVIHWFLSDFQKALEYYFKALDIHEAMNTRVEIAITLTNIGLVYNSQGDYPKALEYLIKGNKIDEELDNKQGIASNLGNIGEIYKRLNDYPKALEYNNKALALYESLGDKNGIARNLGNIGGIYIEQGLYQEALDNHFKALALDREMGLQIGMAANLGAVGGIYLELAKDPDHKVLKTLFNGDTKRALEQSRIYVDSAIVIAQEIGDINRLITLYDGMSEILYLTGDFRGALESYKLSAISSDSVFNMEKDKKLTEVAMQYEFDKKEAKSKAEQEQKDIRQRAIRNSVIAGLISTLIFLGVVIRQRVRIGKEKEISDTERKRSDELLLNILPEEVADELKATGAAKAKAYTMVTVMLTDFKDFTTISEKISAELLVDEIHYCFSAFDEIIQKYTIEKIKTIGDAYLCASGLPVSNYSHAIEIVQAAIEIRDFMERRKAEKEAKGEIPFDIRIGIHTGPVVAGIVGVKKYAYDIWGDTVNLAARMEQNSDAGKINISENTYELVKTNFDCSYRGKIEAKNKGMVNMYFVEPLSLTSPGRNKIPQDMDSEQSVTLYEGKSGELGKNGDLADDWITRISKN